MPSSDMLLLSAASPETENLTVQQEIFIYRLFRQ